MWLERGIGENCVSESGAAGKVKCAEHAEVGTWGSNGRGEDSDCVGAAASVAADNGTRWGVRVSRRWAGVAAHGKECVAE